MGFSVYSTKLRNVTLLFLLLHSYKMSKKVTLCLIFLLHIIPFVARSSLKALSILFANCICDWAGDGWGGGSVGRCHDSFLNLLINNNHR